MRATQEDEKEDGWRWLVRVAAVESALVRLRSERLPRARCFLALEDESGSCKRLCVGIELEIRAPLLHSVVEHKDASRPGSPRHRCDNYRSGAGV